MTQGLGFVGLTDRFLSLKCKLKTVDTVLVPVHILQKRDFISLGRNVMKGVFNPGILGKLLCSLLQSLTDCLQNQNRSFHTPLLRPSHTAPQHLGEKLKRKGASRFWPLFLFFIRAASLLILVDGFQ